MEVEQIYRDLPTLETDRLLLRKVTRGCDEKSHSIQGHSPRFTIVLYYQGSTLIP